MRSAFSDIIGNQSLCHRLSEDLAAHRLSHAYILEGPEGTGKHMLAMRIAAALACEHQNDAEVPLPCMRCAACKKILAGNSPDVIMINRGDKATLGVEAVRDLRRDVWVAPNDISAKIYIIEEAHLMTAQAQNALLLTLEEPPAYVLFLLLCESTATLLETVKSRAPTLRTEPIPTSQIDAYLTQRNTEAALLKQNAPEEYTEILAAAGQSIGHALELLDPKRRKPILAKRANAKEFVRLCAARKNSAAAMKFLNGWGQKRDELTEQLNLTLYCVRDLLLSKQTDNPPLCFFADSEEAISLAYDFTTPELLQLCDCINEAVDAMRMNANVRLTVTALAIKTGLL